MNNDWKLKLVALILAIFVWFHAVTEKVYVSTIVIPIEYQNVPSNLYLLGNPPKACTLLVRGKGKVLIALSIKKKKLKIDLHDYKAGAHTLQISPPKFRNVEVIDIRPKEAKIVVDRGGERKVEVKPVLSGTPAPDFAIVDVRLKPKKVIIRGPRSIIFQIKQVETDTVRVGEEHSSFALKVPVVIKHEYEDLIKALPGSVMVSVIIRPKDTVSLSLVVTPRNTGKFRVKIDPKRVTVMLKVNPKYKTNVNRKTVKAWVDIGSVEKSGKYKLPVHPEFPKYAELISIKPAKVEVIVRQKMKNQEDRNDWH